MASIIIMNVISIEGGFNFIGQYINRSQMQKLTTVNQSAVVFGMPTLPRAAQPSMFDILSWTPAEYSQNNTNNATTSRVRCESNEVGKSRKRCLTVAETKYQLNSQDQVILRKNCSEAMLVPKAILVSQKGVKEKEQTLSSEEVMKRKERIKKFEYVTRDMPNSSSITYYGKPAFQAYGRGSSNPKLTTHNVMPHSGSNHPTQLQTYYSALVKGKKIHPSNYIPRMPITNTIMQHPVQPREIIHLPMHTPDLIHHIRFTEKDAFQSKNQPIPKYEPILKTKKTNKRNSIKERQRKSKTFVDADLDGLKFINTRESLVRILEDKKSRKSKLAYKVTECYPYEWSKKELLKNMQKFDSMKPAGIPYPRQEKLKDLLRTVKESPF